jgi:hypothetical protein
LELTNIGEYKHRSKENTAKKKAVRNPHIQDSKLRSMDINEMLKVRQELKEERRRK